MKIAYRELGQGKSQYPLVMLVHLAATMDNWDPKLIDNLAEKNHIIVMDLPGVGASEGEIAESIPCMADQAIAIIKALGYQKINLLGLSMGGFIAQEIVRLDANLVNTLALAGTGPRAGIGVDKVTYKHIANGFTRCGCQTLYFYNPDKAGKVEAHKVLDRLLAVEDARTRI